MLVINKFDIKLNVKTYQIRLFFTLFEKNFKIMKIFWDYNICHYIA